MEKVLELGESTHIAKKLVLLELETFREDDCLKMPYLEEPSTHALEIKAAAAGWGQMKGKMLKSTFVSTSNDQLALRAITLFCLYNPVTLECVNYLRIIINAKV